MFTNKESEILYFSFKLYNPSTKLSLIKNDQKYFESLINKKQYSIMSTIPLLKNNIKNLHTNLDKV